MKDSLTRGLNDDRSTDIPAIISRHPGRVQDRSVTAVRDSGQARMTLTFLPNNFLLLVQMVHEPCYGEE